VADVQEGLSVDLDEFMRARCERVKDERVHLAAIYPGLTTVGGVLAEVQNATDIVQYSYVRVVDTGSSIVVMDVSGLVAYRDSVERLYARLIDSLIVP
jgi:hypothetical protein